MRNPLKNALHALRHNRKHLLYALLHRFSWLFPDDRRYLKLYYKLSVGKPLNLEPPVTFNEKQQWLKLYDRKDIYTTMADKVAVKDYVSRIIGPEYVIPTIKVWKRPGDVDFDLMMRQAKDAGIDGVIFVAKHHDGFCLWPTKTTEYNITKSPYKGGKGDMVRDAIDAARRQGLRTAVD